MIKHGPIFSFIHHLKCRVYNLQLSSCHSSLKDLSLLIHSLKDLSLLIQFKGSVIAYPPTQLCPFLTFNFSCQCILIGNFSHPCHISTAKNSPAGQFFSCWYFATILLIYSSLLHQGNCSQHFVLLLWVMCFSHLNLLTTSDPVLS